MCYWGEALALGPTYRRAELLLAIVYATLGELRLREGAAPGAQRAFREALSFDPGNTTANLHVGIESNERGQPARALAHFEAATARTPYSVNAQAAAGQALMAMGRLDEALDYLRTALVLGPELAETHRLTCQCLRRLGDLDGALAACRTARRLDADSPPIALELADTLYAAGRHYEATALLRDAPKANRSARPLRLRLAWWLATSPEGGIRNGAEALRLVAPVAKRSDDPRVLNVLAAALAESGRLREARAAAARGAELATRRGQPELAREIRERGAEYETRLAR